MRSALVSSALLLGVLIGAPSPAAVVRVDQSGGGDFLTIQEGLSAASSGDTVSVAAGVYSGDGNRDLRFGGKNLVLVSLSGATETVIDCEASESDPHRGFVFDSGEEPSSVVDGFTILNALADSGGAALCIGSSSPTFRNDVFRFNHGRGGSLFLSGASSTVEGCVFEGEECAFEDCPTEPGGAIFLVDSSLAMLSSQVRGLWLAGADGAGIRCARSTLLMEDCLIEECQTVFGGRGAGLFCTESDVSLSESILRGNDADEQGGAVFCRDCDLKLTDVQVECNRSHFSNGGGVYAEACSLRVMRADFVGNSASMYGSGGGMYAARCSGTVSHSSFRGNGAVHYGGNLAVRGDDLAFENCEFTGGCTYGNYGEGGNVYCDGSPTFTDVVISHGYAESWGGGMACSDSPVLTRVTFTDNHAEMCGGGLYGGLWYGTPLLRDCTFVDNDCGYQGGAMYASPVLIGCTFVNNRAASADYRRGGALCCGPSTVIDGCTFAANEAPEGSAVAVNDAGEAPLLTRSILSFGVGGAAVWCAPGASAVVESCCVFGNAGGDSLCGGHHDNILIDPLFCDLACQDLTLHDNSLCLPANNLWGKQIGAHGAGGCGNGPLECSFRAFLTEPLCATLWWTVGPLGGIEGFSIYRSSSADGPFVRITPEPLPPASPSVYEDRSIWPGSQFWYDLRAVRAGGIEESVTAEPPTVMTGGSLGTKLYSASPNPFHDLTRLQFDVASAGSDVRLTVFDPAGRVVKQLQDGCDRPGRYVATWDGTDSDGVRVASGVYYCLFEAGSVRDMRAVALVR